MFNYDQIQKRLQSPMVTKEHLINYILNPSRSVPSILAMSELRRREEAQSAPAQVGDNQTVANQIVAQAEPGISGLPTGDMYDEKNFAGGGIIAFDKGGHISPHADVIPLTNEEKQILAAEYLAGADLGDDKLSAGIDYAGMVDRHGISKPELQNIHARYKTDDDTEYRGSYAPTPREIMLERIKNNTSLGITASPDQVGIRGV